jgi:hypothetical protein
MSAANRFQGSEVEPTARLKLVKEKYFLAA